MPATSSKKVVTIPKIEFSSFDEIKTAFEKAKSEWITKFSTYDSIKQWVFSLLNNDATQIIMKMMGFDNHYGRSWEVDHCNGRADNTAVGMYLKNQYQKAVGEWIDTQMKELPQLSERDISSIKESYLRSYRSEVERATRNAGTKQAKIDILEFMKNQVGHEIDESVRKSIVEDRW